jgi:ADP-dependent glucokinase
VLGGNAPVMSQRLAMEGWDVLLGARLSPATLKTLHPSVQLSINSSSDIKEDVHLIMEYDLNAEWGRYKSPRANRFILHNDYSNMMLQSMDGFVDKMVEFKPHLIIISGLQMLDNFRYNHSIRTMKLKVISDMLVSTPSDVKIHFEMASFTEDKLLKELLEYIIPYADSIGMNEQELANLHNLLVYKSVNLVSDYSPRIATALDMARNVSKILRNNRPTNSRLLTRIHVHTLAYQAIFTEMGSGWVHTRSATAKASLMANRHVCSSQTINVENAKLIMDDSFSVSVLPNSQRIPLIEESPVSCWGEENFKICVAPNLVCTAIHKTASAGDNISAAGLSIQL